MDKNQFYEATSRLDVQVGAPIWNKREWSSGMLIKPLKETNPGSVKAIWDPKKDHNTKNIFISLLYNSLRATLNKTLTA